MVIVARRPRGSAEQEGRVTTYSGADVLLIASTVFVAGALLGALVAVVVINRLVARHVLPSVREANELLDGQERELHRDLDALVAASEHRVRREAAAAGDPLGRPSFSSDASLADLESRLRRGWTTRAALIAAEEPRR